MCEQLVKNLQRKNDRFEVTFTLKLIPWLYKN